MRDKHDLPPGHADVICYNAPHPGNIKSISMAENLLILVPKSFDAAPPDREGLLDALRDEQFIAEALEVDGEQHYRPGDEFMMLITFLGCSPMIATGDVVSDGEQFCHIATEGPLARPRFLSGDNLKVPRCPMCGHRHDNWQTIIEEWSADPRHTFPCPTCDAVSSAPLLRWRKCAGFGRFFIKVWGIFESEAVPSPNFMAELKKVSGIEWQHFYIRNQ